MRRGRYIPRMAPLAVKADIFEMLFEVPQSEKEFELLAGGAVAVVEISGPLCQRPGWFWDSYEEIEQRVQAALASSAKSLILRIDSPGGDALGCFECARSIRDAAVAAKKPLYAFADGTAASAAYALACSATTGVYLPPAGFVGSVGVLFPVIDVTAQDAMWGVRYKNLKSGARKVDGNPHESLSKEGEEELQARVNALAGLFFDLVAEFRPSVTAEHVRGLEARMFLGETAVGAGLADAVKTWAEVVAMAAGTPAKADVAGGKSMDTEKKAAAMKAIRDAYGDDKDGADKAIKSAFPDEGEKKDEKKDGEKSDDEKKADKAKAEEDEKKAAKASEDKKEEEKALAARGHAGDVKALQEIAFSAAAETQKLRAEIAAKDEAHEREQLLAKRPDFDTNIRATLAGMPIAKLKEAVETWPRVGPVKLTPPAALSAQGTRGANREALPEATDDEKAFIAKKMHGAPKATGIEHKGTVLELGMMTQEQARAHVAAQNTPAAAGGQKGAA
jgi:capsid assembly protease